MEFTFFLGIDVSKEKLDFALNCGETLLFHQVVENTPKALQAFFKELLKIEGFSFEKTLACLEHTGIYSNHILNILFKKKAKVWLENAVQIKKSIGLVRGKSDKIDSKRIAEYAYDRRAKARFWEPKRELVKKLAYFSTLRTNLVDAQKRLSTSLKESSSFIEKSLAKIAKNVTSQSLTALARDIEKVENEIQLIIKSDTELSRLFSQITSVKGVGPVIANHIIIYTNEFKDISNPKKFACYSGVAPFPDGSGKFKGKDKVSHFANKKMKALLSMGATVAIQHDTELRNYYQRKTQDEKKDKSKVINAVRNKLILRIFACVNQNRKYEKNYIRTLA